MVLGFDFTDGDVIVLVTDGGVIFLVVTLFLLGGCVDGTDDFSLLQKSVHKILWR